MIQSKLKADRLAYVDESKDEFTVLHMIKNGISVATKSELKSAITKFTTTGGTIVIVDEIAIDEDITIPSTIQVGVLHSGLFNISAGITLTINGPLEAGLFQIFSGDGIVAGNPKIKVVYPEWFGAVGDGVTDDTIAFTKTSSIYASLYLTQQYVVSSVMQTYSIIGSQGSKVILTGNGAVEIIKPPDSNDNYAVPLNYITIDGSDSTNSYIVRILRKRISSRGLRLTGKINASQKGLFFDISADSQTFHHFEQFDIHSIDYPIWIEGSNSFNSNYIGSLNDSYMSDFKTAVTIGTTNDLRFNKFGAYLKSGDVGVEFYSNKSTNIFEFSLDGVSTLIKPHLDITGGNTYILHDEYDYSVDTSIGSSWYDRIVTLASPATLYNRFLSPVLKSLSGMGFYQIMANDDNTCLELVDSGYAGTEEDWRKAGYLGMKFKEAMALYNSTSSQLEMLIDQTGTGIRKSFNRDIVTFTDGDTTPSVADSNIFMTDNTSSTSITILDDGIKGQEVTILVGDDVTTFVHSNSFQLAGATNWSPNNGDVLRLIYDGSVWREVSRSDNT